MFWPGSWPLTNLSSSRTTVLRPCRCGISLADAPRSSLCKPKCHFWASARYVAALTLLTQSAMIVFVGPEDLSYPADLKSGPDDSADDLSRGRNAQRQPAIHRMSRDVGGP